MFTIGNQGSVKLLLFYRRAADLVEEVRELDLAAALVEEVRELDLAGDLVEEVRELNLPAGGLE